VVFLIELLQRLFSLDYRALAAQSASLPPLKMFGQSWAAKGVLTWVLPFGLMSAGACLLAYTRKRLQLKEERA